MTTPDSVVIANGSYFLHVTAEGTEQRLPSEPDKLWYRTHYVRIMA